MGYTGMPGVEQRPAPPMSVADAGEDWALLALLGDPVEHTNSPVVHHAAMAALGMRGVYVPLQTPMGAVAAALEDLQAAGAMGCNVTVPLKVEAAASVDRLDTGARRSGAVNTVRFSAGAGTEGFNTDADGVRMAAAELLGGATAGATALVVGTGGAARGAIVGLADCGARVLATGRNPGHLEAMVAGLEGLAVSVDPGGLPGLEGGVDLLVQCTSQGMHGVPPSGPLEPVKVLEALRPKAVLDMVYSPGGTDLVRAAVAQGLPCAGGDRVLLLQAAVGFEVWTGRKAPLQAMEGALRAALGRPG
jgi:shikimate dehydrogenase